jgi:hypothetical protein
MAYHEDGRNAAIAARLCGTCLMSALGGFSFLLAALKL